MKSLFCSNEGSFSDNTYPRNANVLASIFTNHVTRLDTRTIWQFILSLTGVRKFHAGIQDLTKPNLNHRPCTMELISFLFRYICNMKTSRWLNAVKSSRAISRLTAIYFASKIIINPLNAKLNPICCLLALLGAHHFLHVSRIRVKSLTLRLLMKHIYGAPILDVSRSHTTTHHSR
jgi:hypothetical protein